MPVDTTLYSDDWNSLALSVKEAAQWRCHSHSTLLVGNFFLGNHLTSSRYTTATITKVIIVYLTWCLSVQPVTWVYIGASTVQLVKVSCLCGDAIAISLRSLKIIITNILL